MYEYQLITQAVDIDWDDGTPLSHADLLLSVAHRWLPEVEQTLATAQGGGWELVSHDVLKVADGLVITLLARRESSGASHQVG